MTFRGYFALNQVEIANSSRVVSHLGREAPSTDLGLLTNLEDCALTETAAPGLFEIPASATEVSPGLYTPPNGARRFGPGLYDVGECWGPPAVCLDCNTLVLYDDTWPGLGAFLDEDVYRPELAPWFNLEAPESTEFSGVWVMSVTGLDTTPLQREIMDTIGPGGAAAPPRDRARTLTFEALLIGCTNAGVQYGLNWLTCRLRETNYSTSTALRYLTAHPGLSGADPDSLVREMRGVVLTAEPTISEQFVTGSGRNRQANIYRVSWEMTALSPYAYFPPITLPVTWDRITRQPINWIHAADCTKPETCEDMPVLFSADCVPEEIPAVYTPSPVCGGCMPISGIDKYSYQVPTQDYVYRCRDTAVSLVIENTGDAPLTLQAFWRVCGTDVRCEDNQWPLQVSALPVAATLYLDGITGRYWVTYDGRNRRPIGMVGTPTGAPWRPPVIDRQTCWEFVVQAATTAEFDVTLTLADREA